MEKDGINIPLHFLGDKLEFPPVEMASADGLLAVGGDLSPERLLLAYKNGIFPWFNEDALILWWSPDPRMVLFPQKVKVSKSMRRVMRSQQFTLTQNQCFEQVLDCCAQVERKDQEGTWITPNMKSAYMELFQRGIARSLEVWQENTLVGGLYGVDLGHVFCGESMFSLTSNASKFAFVKLAEDCLAKNYKLIDCQVHTPHLESLGAELISRSDFMGRLKG
ncbi:leucyl/phenylalanyl-tRNA--protein transferase [Flagellimonas algicola]|uniref:Leucyl/phenylalanyl-tRNA--protein transferase n=1 Tax=Flagellimonas algicola TaxID=2583815 RepID=A0ABY2WL19_9FLAO|nr:leucyl/phenylalanyl-tRNA--protein transferase [Allomuricauda algicola]TMU55413.1 leucyl/phenylalanyl-tRNA--protein transferase [Allomuricauda algicola]